MSLTETRYEHIVLDANGVALIAGTTMKVGALVLERMFTEPETGHLVMQQSVSALDRAAQSCGFDPLSIRYFSFRNQRITPFEAIQRWALDPLAHGPLAPRLRRWFYWESLAV